MRNNKKQKILIVDDLNNTSISLQNILQKHRFDIISASKGKRALDLISNEKPEIVFLDLLENNLNASHILGKIKNNGNIKDSSVIMMTKSNKYEDVETSLKNGVTDNIIKAFDCSDLLENVNSVLYMKYPKNQLKSDCFWLKKAANFV